MEAVTILPNTAQQEPRKTLGLNSYADDAEILLDEPKTVKKSLYRSEHLGNRPEIS